LFADPDGRVGPNEVELHVVRYVVGGGHRGRESIEVGRSESAGSTIDIDRPHVGSDRALGKCARYRAVSTPQIQNIGVTGFGHWGIEQKQPGPWIHLISGKHTSIAVQCDREVWKDEIDRSWFG